MMSFSVGPEIQIYYLGHSSFIFHFDNGLTILTDYGRSCAYGLDSPIYDLGHFMPDIVTYSHHHEDHDRGLTFPSARVLDGDDLDVGGISLNAVRVSEKDPGDNYGYLITYKDTTIFHAGDSQGDIVRIQDEKLRHQTKSQLPVKINLLLVPIGWVRDITEQAAVYVDCLSPERVIPMHYWSVNEKKTFLAKLKEFDKIYDIHEIGGPTYALPIFRPPKNVEVISLTPAAYKR